VSLKILITGAGGLLASSLIPFFPENSQLYLLGYRTKLAFSNSFSFYGDASDFTSISRFFELIRPNIVINCAALANVEQCELDTVLAYKTNVLIARHLALLAFTHQAKLIHISTDHLTDGVSSYVDECHPTYPLNFYASTKLAAELVVGRLCPSALIIRTNFFCTSSGSRPSFSDWILRSLRLGSPLRLFTDSYFTPIHTTLLFRALASLLDLNASGIFNVCSNDRISKYQFGTLLSSHFGHDPSLITPVSLSSRPERVPRPPDMSLSNRKFCLLTGHSIGSVDSMIHLLSDPPSNTLLSSNIW